MTAASAAPTIPALASEPSVAVWPNNGEQDVFWKGADNSLWEASWSNGWQGPVDLGMGPLGSAPTAAVNPYRCEDDVFWKGTDNNLWEAVWSCSSGWHGPFRIGMGPLGSQPSVTVWPNSPGQQDVFWEGTDGNLWEAYWNNGWHGPYDTRNTSNGAQMGPLGSSPMAATNPALGQENVFWRGTDGDLWGTFWSGGSGWIGPSKTGITSTPPSSGGQAWQAFNGQTVIIKYFASWDGLGHIIVDPNTISCAPVSSFSFLGAGFGPVNPGYTSWCGVTANGSSQPILGANFTAVLSCGWFGAIPYTWPECAIDPLKVNVQERAGLNGSHGEPMAPMGPWYHQCGGFTVVNVFPPENPYTCDQ
jgi:hypothetical protein